MKGFLFTPEIAFLPSRVIPKTFNKDTAVVLAQAVNSSQASTSVFFICSALKMTIVRPLGSSDT